MQNNDATTSRPLKRKADAGPGGRAYREPEGPRKSRRIAGKAAEPAAAPPKAAPRPKARKRAAPVATEATHDAPGEDAAPAPMQYEAATSQPQDIEGVSAPVEKFLGVLASTTAMHKTIGRLKNDWTNAFASVDRLTFEPEGLIDLQQRMRAMERQPGFQQEELRKLHDSYKAKEAHFARLQDVVPNLTEAMTDLNPQHSESNSQLYDFKDLPRDHPALKLLPDEFWVVYDHCNAVNALCKSLQKQIHDAKQKQQEIRQAFATPLHQSLLQAATAGNANARVTPLPDSVEAAEARIVHLGKESVNINRLKRSLDQALDQRYMRETRLHRLAEKVFIDASLLEAEKDVREVELHRRPKSTPNDTEG